LQLARGAGSIFVKASAREVEARGEAFRIHLDFEGAAAGWLDVVTGAQFVRFSRLELSWTKEPVPIQGLHFGMSELPPERIAAAPDGVSRFWPDWRAEGFCVPGAKGNPGQSFWRSWDMGNAVLPLGSFGPSMGTPYAAAFPRPLLAAAMGGSAGWLSFGPGVIPAAALILDIQASSARLRYWMREDLWGGKTCVWEEPLRLAWAESGWDALASLFATFEVKAEPSPHAQRSQWGTWGDFKEGRFDLDVQIERAAEVGAEDLQIDDLWETWNSSGVVERSRFPELERQLSAARARKIQPALWMSIGWVDKPEEAGLEPRDLLCRRDGLPVLAHWGFDPRTSQHMHYCLDPSSEKAREFLRTRTHRVMRELQPGMLKLDFGYGLPSPDAAAPRDPAFRGERLCYELLNIIRNAAREVNPRVVIEYYGIHPLMRSVYELLSLDDMGDMGEHEVSGHHQRSAWAALAGVQDVGMMAASGYYWNEFDEMLLNSAVLGAPGACLPEMDSRGKSRSARITSLFRALSKWHRRTVGWTPLWLNSHKGDLRHEPYLRCWGRLEGGKLSALILREGGEQPDLSRWGIAGWKGRWALIVQDDRDLAESAVAACIPFDEGATLHWANQSWDCAVVHFSSGTETEKAFPLREAVLAATVAAPFDNLMGFLLTRK
jgi:hypothetical protein